MPNVPTDWILTLETSVTNATLLLAQDGHIFAQSSFTSERSQECDLYGPLQELLAQIPNGAKLSAIVIGTGPGSYNGARVGIAAAQAIAQVHHCRVAGVCSFEAVPEISRSKTAWAIGDARRGSFFLMPIMNGRTLAPPQLLEEAEFLAALADCPGMRITFESPDRLPAGVDCTQSASTAEGLLAAWLDRSESEREALLETPTEAFYLRPPHITKSKKSLQLKKI
jgi:tRNA threonylcarbamoyladenosine biosynthesis protein TsaB